MAVLNLHFNLFIIYFISIFKHAAVSVGYVLWTAKASDIDTTS